VVLGCARMSLIVCVGRASLSLMVGTATIDHQREDGCCTSDTTSHAASPRGSGNSMDRDWKASGGLGLSGTNQERPCRSQYRQKAAHSGAEAVWSPAICLVFAAPHVSYSAR